MLRAHISEHSCDIWDNRINQRVDDNGVAADHSVLANDFTTVIVVIVVAIQYTCYLVKNV